MLTDHSKTYRLNDVRNIVHIMRLRGILRTLAARVKNRPQTYVDYGCSNGFITNQVAEQVGVSQVIGFDHTDNIYVGARLYPQMRFRRFDLNVVHEDFEQCDLVTCFETLEHVGNMSSAVENVCRSRAPGGTLLITVPIEIGWIGLLKYVLKRFVFRYDLALSCTDRQYFGALLRGDRIGRFRPPALGYGTHFGFDYRDVDELLARHSGAPFEAWNAGTTRFYFIGGA